MVAPASPWPFNAPPVPYNSTGRSITAATYDRTASGTSSAADATTMTDGGAAWAVNAYAGLTVYTGGKFATIASNTDTVLTLSSAWHTGTPADTVPYIIANADSPGLLLSTQVGVDTIFTVTGPVIIRFCVGIMSEAMTQEAATATLSMGVVGAATVFSTAQTVDPNFAAGDIWVTGANPGGGGAAVVAKDVITSANIITTTAAQNILSGKILYYCFWDPLAAGSLVTSHILS